ncbi:MAG TPA: cupin domain-containing protein [Lacipirellulaceae bacterium]
MNIETFFGSVSLTGFIDQYLHRLPFSLAGSAIGACELGTWDSLSAMLGPPEGDVLAVREGRWYEGPPLTELSSVRALVDEGHTVFVRHAERHHPCLAELAAAFEKAFLGPVNIHVFVTPAGAPGFSWHYDAEDVFIIQTQGVKEYSLRKNTVNPWPLEETLPADMHYERELMPLMRVLLEPGDLLYIPCGYWHKAESKTCKEGGQSPVAISLAVGVMSRAAIDVYDFLRKRLVESLLWRQRLPLPNAAGRSRVELEAMYRQLFQQLGDDLKKIAADPQIVREFLDWFEHGEKST